MSGTRTLYLAGFWRRFFAMLLDSLILSLINGVVFGLSFLFGLGFVAVAGIDAGEAVLTMAASITSFLSLYINWLYFAGMESSARGATPGKMALGISVSDLYGRRATFERATARHFSKIISSFVLMIGWIMTAFTSRKQSLHDLISGCLVIYHPPGSPVVSEDGD